MKERKKRKEARKAGMRYAFGNCKVLIFCRVLAVKCYILLSPAAASYDQFKNFEIIGTEFKKLCKTYARKFI